MTTYTAELWQAIDLSRGHDIGLGAYPIFDETYRAPLNVKIIEHFWNREIGMETIDMFRLAMRRKMNEIMPLYNQLYKSQQLVIDPLNTMKLKTVFTNQSEQVSDNVLNEINTASGTSTSNTNNESSGRTVNQDFPQTALANDADYAESAVDTSQRAAAAATAAENTSNNHDATGNTTSRGDDKGDSETSGWQGSQSTLLQMFRDTFLNIDMQIIEELEELFMSVWNNNDQYTDNNRRGYTY